MSWRRVRAVVADEMHANAQAAQSLVIERTDVQRAIFARHESVSGAVIRFGRKCALEPGRDAKDQVSVVFLQRLAKKAASLRAPGVFDLRVQLARKQVGDFIFKTFELVVRKRKVVWVSRDADDVIRFRRGESKHRREQREREGEHTRPRVF